MADTALAPHGKNKMYSGEVYRIAILYDGDKKANIPRNGTTFLETNKMAIFYYKP